MLFRSIGIGVAVVLVAPAVVAAPASATTTATNTFVYSGSNTDSKTIIDTGLFYIDGCSHPGIDENDPTACLPDGFPGTLWGRARAGIDFTVLSSQTADFSLTAPDSFRQDVNAPFAVTLTAKDAAGQEIKVQAKPWFNVDLAYDTPIANCPKNTITSTAELDAASTAGCLNRVVHSGRTYLASYDLLAKDLLAEDIAVTCRLRAVIGRAVAFDGEKIAPRAHDDVRDRDGNR